jgi:TolA-binding protein
VKQFIVLLLLFSSVLVTGCASVPQPQQDSVTTAVLPAPVSEEFNPKPATFDEFEKAVMQYVSNEHSREIQQLTKRIKVLEERLNVYSPMEVSGE